MNIREFTNILRTDIVDLSNASGNHYKYDMLLQSWERVMYDMDNGEVQTIPDENGGDALVLTTTEPSDLVIYVRDEQNNEKATRLVIPVEVLRKALKLADELHNTAGVRLVSEMLDQL